MERENSISFRFAIVFGVSSRMRNDLITNDFTYIAIHDRSLVIFAGHSKRTFIHIDNAIRAYIFALDSTNSMDNNITNVGDEPLKYSKNDIVKTIKKYVAFEIIDSSLSDLDVNNFLISFKKIKQLGYKTQRSIDDSIKDLIKLYKFYNFFSHYKVI